MYRPTQQVVKKNVPRTKSDKERAEVVQVDEYLYIDNLNMSATGASGGPLANSIPTTMATLPHEQGAVASDGDASPKEAHTPDNASDGEREIH